MRSTASYRRRSSAGFWLGLLLVLLLGAGGVAATLAMLGVNLNPFAGPREDPYMVRLPINSRPIPAYERVDRSHLMNAATGALAFQKIPPAATVGMTLVGVAADGSHVEDRVAEVRNVNDQVVFVDTQGRQVTHGQTLSLGGALLSVNSILGRVVKKDKKAGMAFREETFFPQGTPEGLAGATPPGMRAVTLDATKLTGVHALNSGDRIDLLASVPVDEVGAFSSQYNGRLPGASLTATGGGERGKTATEPMLLAQNAVVLKPVYVRNEATASSSLTQGKRIQNVPKYEVAIAVAPDDVVPLQSALNKSLEITCIAHSMQAGAGGEAVEPVAARPTETVVPVTIRAILAFEVVGREAFVSPATRRVRMEPVSQQQIDRLGIVTSLDEALGAVARHDIPAGSFLRKADLLSGVLEEKTPRPVSPASPGDRSAVTRGRRADASSSRDASFQLVSTAASRASQPSAADPAAAGPNVVGDRPAITRFVPPGRTAFAIPWNRLYGAEHLQIGDKIDLLASYSLQQKATVTETERRPDGTVIDRKRDETTSRETLRTWDETFGNRGEPWFVAGDALVVGPVGFPAPASALRALGQKLERTTDKDGMSGPPLLIAVDDRDVEAMAAALSTEGALFTPAFHPSGEEREAPAGMKRVAVAAQTVPAFELFTETVWQGNRRRPVSRLVAIDDPRFADALTPDAIVRYDQRVLGRQKRRGDFFLAEDFLPAGASPGPAAVVEPGQTLFVVADREIEGLDAFEPNDRVAILVRGVVKAPEGVVTYGVNLERPVADVVVPSARIVRESRGGRTVLAIANDDLSRLQAALARSLADRDADGRTHLLAVALPRDGAPAIAANGRRGERSTTSVEPIPGFDPARGLRTMETIIDGKRQTHVFPAANSDDHRHRDARYNAPISAAGA